jgi:two-component system OmpR family response regulator
VSIRVLVVEDDAPVASVLERGLGLAGHSVVVAEDGTVGLTRWEEGGWDAVVLDVMLPGIDGLTVCRRRRAAGDATPVLLLTARDDEELRATAATAGSDAFMTKPFAYTELLATLERLVAARRR